MINIAFAAIALVVGLQPQDAGTAPVEQVPQPAPATTEPEPTPEPDPDPEICRTRLVPSSGVGQRFTQRRICKLRSEWEQGRRRR